MPVIGHNDQDLAVQVCLVIARALELPPQSVSAQAKQGELDKWDSLGHLNVVMEIEAEFGVSFSTDEAIAMRSVPQIVTIVAQHLHH